jgi:DNA phosphorothioation-associated putative methyltransferase
MDMQNSDSLRDGKAERTPKPERSQEVDYEAIASLCQNSTVGKLLPGALYVHITALDVLDPLLQKWERRARGAIPHIEAITLVKFSTTKPKISYLFYPDFDIDPHPGLRASIQVNLETLETSQRDYSKAKNPPILHRKETFITPDYPLYDLFSCLTKAQEAIGLLDKTSTIGTRKGWLERLQTFGVELNGHALVMRHSLPFIPQIQRHKAALVRHDLSRPVRVGLEAGLFAEGMTFFDYGCGYGGDVSRMAERGYRSRGWDPYYSPHTPFTSADIVNLGYVINVIEDLAERREALINAWRLTQKILLVAAQVLIDDCMRGVVAYGDGVITSRNTFQKYYEQEELKNYIDRVLDVDAIPIGLGIYCIFRDETAAETFRASRFRSRTTTPRVRIQVKRFEDYQELLTPLMVFVTERGRLPEKGEMPEEEAKIITEFRSFRRAFDVILQATDPQEWEAIADKRRQDLKLYLALSQFGKRPKLSKLAPEVQEDIKALFGTYKQACLEADCMLFSLGDPSLIAEYCRNSTIGKNTANAFCIHVSALDYIDPILRLYEGCASRTIGRLENTNVIKIYTKIPKISYLFYPDFETEPHPALYTEMQIDLRDLHVTYRDYDEDDDPPILHQKDALITPDHPFYAKWSKLTRQEEDWGLLDDWQKISRRSGWLKCLEDHCSFIQNHRLFRRKDAAPYKLRVLRAAVQTRQRKRQKAEIKVNEQLNISDSLRDEIEKRTAEDAENEKKEGE